MTTAPESDWLPLTAAQRGLFFAHHLDPRNPSGTTAETVQFAGPIDPARLQSALTAAYAEFEQLRAVFTVGPEGPRQRVGPPSSVDLRIVDVADEASADSWLRADLSEPFDLATGVCRTALLRFPDGRCWWHHAAHHVVVDGYGAQQLLRRVADLYDGAASAEAVPLTALIAADADDQRRIAGDDFWQRRLTDMRGSASPAGREASPAPTPLRAAADLDPALADGLLAAAEQLGVAWPDLIVAAVGGYVARIAGTTDTRVGVPLMNRVRPGDGALPAALTVCTAMNVLPVRVQADTTVAEATRLAAEDHADVRAHPLERQEDLARTLRVRGDQLFGVQVNLVPFSLALSMGGVPGRVRNDAPGPVEDMTICLRGAPGRGRSVRLEIDANPLLYEAEDVAAHLQRVASWLDAWTQADSAAQVDDLPLLPAEELHAVVHRFNDTRVDRESATLARRFLDQVQRTPDVVAVIDGDDRRTYAELLRAARSIAAGLRARGVTPGDVVGVAVPRSAALIETVHAIALTGAVYLPLDPDLPPARREAMVDDAGAGVVVTPETLRNLTGDVSVEPPGDVDAPAYLLFTSGSTGRPKGVVVSHPAIDNRLAWMQHHLPIGPGDRVLHKTPISFDVSIWELFWPLQTGATLVIAPPGDHRDPRALAGLIVDHRIDVLHFVPSMLRAFVDGAAGVALPHRVRHVVTSGEALTPELAAACRDVLGSAPVNLYGPTEAAVDVTVWDCDGDQAQIPIGRPIWNTACFVLDARMRPQPVGVPGELWLGGVQLADGYVGRPELTAERFVAAPTALRAHGDRLYRTGDRAAWRADGALLYLGRDDDQVKVRGQRIELGEIEAVASAAAPAAAALIDDRLVVWVAGDEQALAAARTATTDALPASVLPHHWERVDALPLTPSGKVDRGALARDWRPPTSARGSAPADLTEQRLCAAFGDVLDLTGVGADQDFFALGGDSLRALRLVQRVEDDLGEPLRLADVFAAPTPSALAARLAGGALADDTGEVLTLRPGDPSVAPLFLLPPAGGLGWCYASLLAGLPPHVGVHTVQAPGLTEGRPEPVADLSALAKRQLTAIATVVGSGRFHVAGWSLGGMAAHEVAAQAQENGQSAGAVVLLDAYPADQWRQLPDPTEREALIGILRLGGLEPPSDESLTRQTVVELLQESGSAVGRLPEQVLNGCVASVVEAARLTRTSTHRRYDGDVTLIAAGAPREEDWLDPQGWRPYVGALDVVELPFGHGELVRSPAAGQVAALIGALLT